MMTYAQDPVMLHEFLHVYHARLMPQGYDNRGIFAFYAEGKSKNFYPKEAYVLKNNREFRPARTRLTNPTRGRS